MRIILGVTGCIAAYKSAIVLRQLQQEGCEVLPVMTASAARFVGPLTLEKLSGHKVVSHLFEDQSTAIEHIALARSADLLLVAPATANILAKFANGIADDFLSTLYVSTLTPVVVAPGMNVEMWRHPATRRNVEVLRERGVKVVEPEAGYLACGEVGEGRLADPALIVQTVLEVLGRSRSLEGRRVLVTAGPTLEDIDPVRFISNRSSGKMGYAIAAEARLRGADVTLVSGPCQVPAPTGVDFVSVRSARQMAKAVFDRYESIDIVVMAAAVADFTPEQVQDRKIKKRDGVQALKLVATTDILRELGLRKRHQFLVGFAAESEQLRANAHEKLRQKNLDLIVANDISQPEIGFQSDLNRVSVMGADGSEEVSPVWPKSRVAKLIWDQIENRLPSLDDEPVPQGTMS